MLTACSSGSGGGPSPTTFARTTPDRSGAPVVERPLDVSSFAPRPCELLESQEVRQLGLIDAPRQRTTLDVQSCRWSSREGDDLSLTPDDDRDLLADAYRARGAGVFEPGLVAGYPSVREKSDRGQYNICTVVVGLAARQAVTADWVGTGSPGGADDACVLAERAAALAIRKLPPAS